MPAYKDNKTNKWYVKFYYEDWNGKKHQKKKMGFETKKKALEFEKEYINKFATEPTILFKNLYELYTADLEQRLKKSTLVSKESIIKNHILPYFENMPISDITPLQIRKWQEQVIKKGYAITYQRRLNNVLSGIMNYAVKYYDLPKNPCTIAGMIGRVTNPKSNLNYWTLEEFKKFINCVTDEQLKLAYNILYWCGLRKGELFALTKKDIDFESRTLNINKSLQRINKQDIITTPKTVKSNRKIIVPDFLLNDIKTYVSKLFNLQETELIFCLTTYKLSFALDRICKEQGLKRIKIHDLRHSHASLLVEMGVNPLLIAERLGHENVQTTLNIYSHLYPDKQKEVIEQIEKLK